MKNFEFNCPTRLEIGKEDRLAASEGQKAFQAIRSLAENGQLPDMTLEEINNEINSARRENK